MSELEPTTEQTSQKMVLFTGMGVSLLGIVLGVAGLAMTLYARSTAKPESLTGVIRATESAFQTSSVITVVCAATFMGLLIYRLSLPRPKLETDEPSKTPKTLALSVLAGFILCMVGIFFALKLQINTTDVKVKEWMDMFRSGFTVLTSSMTTIIGFYFAAKQGEKAIAQVQRSHEQEREAQAAELRAVRQIKGL